jgi:hypothetical protein
MALLIVAALLWVGVHVGVAGTQLRDVVVARIGEGPFRGLFSLLSILGLAFLIWCWGRSATTPLWYAPIWLRWVLVAVMLVAFVLFVASVSDRNPTMIGADTARPPRGLHRALREHGASVQFRGDEYLAAVWSSIQSGAVKPPPRFVIRDGIPLAETKDRPPNPQPVSAGAGR